MSREEKISAYVDGELTPAERAEVERLLVDDPAARKLCDELRALRSEVAAVPRFQLNEDLTAAVLRAAERRVLLEPDETSAGTENSAGPGNFSNWKRRAMRPAAYAVLVLAAGLLVMLYAPQRPEPRLAQAPAGRDRAPAAPSAAAEAESMPTELREELKKEGPRAEPSMRSLGKEDSAASTFRDDVADAPTALEAAPREGRLSEKAMPARPEAMNKSGRTTAPEQAGQSFDADPTLGLPVTTAKIAGEQVVPAEETHAPGMLVVTLDFSSEGGARAEFAMALSRNSISYAPLEARVEQEADQSAAKSAVQNARDITPEVSEPSIDTVIVEARPDQIRGVLDDLSQQPERFSVSVVPPLDYGAAQQSQAPLPANDYLTQFPDVAQRRAERGRALMVQAPNSEAASQPPEGNAVWVNRFNSREGLQVVPEAANQIAANYKSSLANQRKMQRQTAGARGGVDVRAKDSGDSAGERLAAGVQPGQDVSGEWQTALFILRMAPQESAAAAEAATAEPEPPR